MIDPFEILKQAFPSVQDNVLKAIATLSRIRSFPPDTVICTEGETGDTFYLVGEGEVEVLKKMSDSEDRLLRRGGAGMVFGEMALLHDTTRSATIKTSQQTTVLELDRTTFVAAIQQNPSMVLTLIRTMIDRMRANDAQTLADLRVEKEKVESAYEELKHQEQKRDEFLDTLAHELRTPLTASKGYLDLLRSGILQGPSLAMAIEKVGFSFNRIISLINDLLFVQEMELLDFGFSKINLREILAEAQEQTSSMNEAQNNQIRIDIADDVPEVLGDYNGLLRAFVHLLGNAVKFSPEGGEIVVKVSANATHVELAFIDHGVGIPIEFMPRLFERFERVETYKEYLFGGLGLGLPIVKHIVESHAGTIHVTSERGQGSTFTIRIPRDAKRATRQIDLGKPENEWVDVPDETLDEPSSSKPTS